MRWKRLAILSCCIVVYLTTVFKIFQGRKFVLQNSAGIWRWLTKDRPYMFKECRELDIETDASGTLEIIRELVVADKEYKKHDVTILTQGDMSKLHHLLKMADSWQGPLEVAVFLAQHTVIHRLLFLVNLLRLCNDAIRRHVTWHVVHPVRDNFNVTFCARRDLKYIINNTNCGEINAELSALAMEASVKTKTGRFPINVLRNVLRNTSRTDFNMVLDIDMVPSKRLRKKFLTFVRQHQLLSDSFSFLRPPPKALYIIPAFESSADQGKLPLTLPSLRKEYYAANKTRPFHDWCMTCYHYTEYERWFNSCAIARKHNETDLPLISHSVRWKMPFEPFYISRNDVPLYDERFSGYGYNKVSQVYETAMARYRFDVLTDMFLIHRGWKNSTRGSKWDEQRINLKCWRKFRWEMQKRHGKRNP